MSVNTDEEYWQASAIKGGFNDKNANDVLQHSSVLKQTLNTIRQDDEASAGDNNDEIYDKGNDDFEMVQRWSEERSNSLTHVASARYKAFESKPAKTGTSAAEIAKLQAEVNHLHRSRTEQLPAWKMVLNMTLDQEHFLEDCRSFEQKKEILKSAIFVHDGNAITKAVLHLARTTKQQLLFQILLKQPVAQSHYLYYLRRREKFTELSDFLEMLGKSEEAAMVKYEAILRKSDPNSMVKNLENFHQSHFSKRHELDTDAAMIEQQLLLLQRQGPIQASDKKAIASGQNLEFQKYPPAKELCRSSLIDTLHYCCMYHRGEKETIFSCPESFRKDFHLTPKQFSYVYVSALAEQMIWTGIEQEIFIKSYLGKQKLKSEISMEKILEIMDKKKTPAEILARFVARIDDLETRLEMSTKYKCHNITIETLVQRRSYHDLRAYCSKLAVGSKERSLAEEALRRPDVRWKTTS